jgi:hypothetical protein
VNSTIHDDAGQAAAGLRAHCQQSCHQPTGGTAQNSYCRQCDGGLSNGNARSPTDTIKFLTLEELAGCSPLCGPDPKWWLVTRLLAMGLKEPGDIDATREHSDSRIVGESRPLGASLNPRRLQVK